ncbi:MAG: carbohydrate ABC transporter permease [Chloroflexi bacterium]|nr:MAG: carbohydrate ABC transporter permease [Chloroflexota bacterium]
MKSSFDVRAVAYTNLSLLYHSPTYTFFQRIGWVGTWLPLIVPAFFANAYDVFLLRQYFMTLPRELDEAAMIDSAGPLRVLWSVIIPQSYPALMAITVSTSPGPGTITLAHWSIFRQNSICSSFLWRSRASMAFTTPGPS